MRKKRCSKILAPVLLALCLVLGAAAPGLAAGSWADPVFVESGYGDHVWAKLTLSWTADGSDGSVPDWPATDTITQRLTGYYLDTVQTDPQSPAPTDGYDITIKNTRGMDLMGGMMQNRSATEVEQETPKVSTSASIYGDARITGRITVSVSGNSVNSAAGVIEMEFSK